MNKKISLSILFFLLAHLGIAQQIPLGSCGIVYVHDAAGNRTRRVYFCNNGVDPYPTIAPPANPGDEQFTKQELGNMELQLVDALYPNPTTGIFYVTFSKDLSSANISIIDITGKTVRQYKVNGKKLTCDLSALPGGTYFVRIEEKSNTITKKVIKQ